MNYSVRPKIVYIIILFASLALSTGVAVCVPFAEKEEKHRVAVESTSADERKAETDALETAPAIPMSDGYAVIGGLETCIHRWDEWILTRASTLEHTGNELRYCLGCGACQNREFGADYKSDKRAYINVKCILQMPNFPNGCEVVSLTMVLNYLGYDVTADTLIDQYLPRGVFGTNGDNPFYKYLGDPRSLGVGCYAPCIVTCANNYLSSIGAFASVSDVSGRGFEAYKKFVSEGSPVIFWGTTYMDCDSEVFGVVNTSAGEVIWRNHSHCFVMIGYTENSYVFCDPLRGIVEYPKADVEESHKLVYEQACVIQK